MSVRNYNVATSGYPLSAADSLAFGTNPFSFGHWIYIVNDRNQYTRTMTFGPSGNIAGNQHVCCDTNNDGTSFNAANENDGTAFISETVGTWYWRVVSKSGTTLTARLFADSTSTTPIGTQTVTVTNSDHGTMVQTTFFEGFGAGSSPTDYDHWLDGNIALGKLEIGREWTDAECRLESLKFGSRTGGSGTKRCWAMNDLSLTVFGLQEWTGIGPTLSAAQGTTRDDTIRPSVLESLDGLRLDNFRRANESPLSGGGLWTPVAGGFTGVMNLTSNVVVGNGTDGPVMRTEAWSADQSSEIVVTDAANTDVGPMVRCSSGKCYVWFVKTGNPGDIQVSTAGAFTGAITTRSTGTVAVGDRFRLEIAGTTLACYKNDVLVGATFTDATLATGAPGIFAFSSADKIGEWVGRGALARDYTLAAWQDRTEWRAGSTLAPAREIDLFRGSFR
jgi:hypothetical protein